MAAAAPPVAPLEGAELEAWLADVVAWHSGFESLEALEAEEPPYLVPRTATPLREAELAELFVMGHLEATGKRPGSRRLLENAIGIIGLENARGRAIIQHNWGNISANIRRWHGPVWQTPVPQSGQPLYFKAYPDHLTGVTAWWRLMYRGGHIRALEFAALGQPVQMVRALYESHYVVGGSRRGYERGASDFAEHMRRGRWFARLGPYRADWVGLASLAGGLAGLTAIGVLHATA